MDTTFWPLLMPLFVFASFFAVMVVGFVFWLAMLVDCARLPDDPSEPSRRVVWTLVLVFTNVAGAVLYYLAVRRPMARARRFGTGAGAPDRFPRHQG